MKTLWLILAVVISCSVFTSAQVSAPSGFPDSGNDLMRQCAAYDKGRSQQTEEESIDSLVCTVSSWR